MGKLDYHSEVTLTVKHNGKTYEYYFPKVEVGQFSVEPNYPAGYWDWPDTIKSGTTSCQVDLSFRAVPNEERIYAFVKTNPPLISRRHPPKKRTR